MAWERNSDTVVVEKKPTQQPIEDILVVEELNYV